MIQVLANSVSSKSSLPGLLTAALFLKAHMAFLLCMPAERESMTGQTPASSDSSSYKDTNPITLNLNDFLRGAISKYGYWGRGRVRRNLGRGHR